METLKDRILSDKNIFLSIYLLDSYIQNKELLFPTEREKLVELKDVFDMKTIKKMIRDVKKHLKRILDDETEYFKVNVFFKPKKYDKGKVFFRPLHTASLIEQIAMIAMLQVLVYDIGENGKLIPSELSRLLPSSFYGNRISFDGQQLFKSWQEQYQEYTTKANEMLYNYSETSEYKYEVSLDLENFFPSINPQVLYNYILKQLPLKLNCEDNNTIKTIVKKLLIFKLSELKEKELGWYLDTDYIDYNELQMKCRYAKGMPQGLPHAYFMANIFMLLIEAEYSKVFPGEMLFYVDDSVIFTNGKTGTLNKELFKENISELNRLIRETCTLVDENTSHNKIFPSDYCYSSNDFSVNVHKADSESVANSKSVFAEIGNAKENSGETYLRGLSRETSNISFDMFTTFSDEEVSMVRSRTNAILRTINEEIRRVDESESPQKVYRNKLLRYKKFFAYRKTILDYKDTGTVGDLKKAIIEDVALINNQNNIQVFFDKYTDDILAATIQFVFKRCDEESVNTNDLIDAIYYLDSKLYENYKQHSYLIKAYEQYLKKEPEYHEFDIYKSLHKSVVQKYRAVREQSNTKKHSKFSESINEYCVGDYKKLYTFLNFTKVFKYSEYVRYNSNNLERMILNTIFSYLFEYQIDDKFTFAKKSRMPIQYSEVRILATLRNKLFSTYDFLDNYKRYSEDEFLQTADYSLLQVLEIFRTFVVFPERIDNLILIHKYCCDTWKNGSKYLHFYTLHNQEHAVSLIRSSIQILHAISYFKLKQIDYFILFAACYLHDISMVTLPDMDKFYTGNNEVANCIYTEFVEGLDIEDSIKTKKALCDAYQKIDGFFETDIRGNHSYNSAMEIRHFKELDFIDSTMRELIAEVSAGHGYDSADIYFAKSVGKSALVNEKFIKMLLRLSDLLDMSRYRISKVILNHNLKNLNEVSRFHWISHLITDEYSLDTEYQLTDKVHSAKSSSYLEKGNIVEKLVLTVNVLMSQTTEVRKKDRCKYVSNSTLHSEEKNKTMVTIACDKDGVCNNVQCNFLCKWFVVKNEYLFKELGFLKRYLNNIQDNFFSSEIEVNIRVIANTDIPNDVFDYLRKYVETS